MVEAAVLVRPLERDHVDRLLDHADNGAVAACVEADHAELLLGQVAALAAEADALLHFLDRVRERDCLVLLRREDVEREPIPGSRVSCATRLSTEGLSTSTTYPSVSDILPRSGESTLVQYDGRQGGHEPSCVGGGAPIGLLCATP